ncbi:unnamed protein product [Prorocentrum cordatum]|uniref:Fanconi-associated nuclease n=1 Tax=Prorocentrum cordatum TaxID=2364126 RepID=A0ABN9XDV3_9DINO|nr:unnamed protein product [Polarella glacialis]
MAANPPAKRKHRCPTGGVPPLTTIDDAIFAASWATLSSTCSANGVPCGGARSILLQRLATHWTEPDPPPRTDTSWALRKIRTLEAELVALRAGDDADADLPCVDPILAIEDAPATFPIADEPPAADAEASSPEGPGPAREPPWRPDPDFQDFADNLLRDASAALSVWTRMDQRADAVTMYHAYDELRSRPACTESHALWWLSLLHIVPRRRPVCAALAALAAASTEPTEANALAMAAAVRAYPVKETRWDTSRPVGGTPVLDQLLRSPTGMHSLLDHAAATADLQLEARTPRALDLTLETSKTKLPVLHVGCKYTRGHHLRLIDALASRTVDAEWSAEDWDAGDDETPVNSCVSRWPLQARTSY